MRWTMRFTTYCKDPLQIQAVTSISELVYAIMQALLLPLRIFFLPWTVPVDQPSERSVSCSLWLKFSNPMEGLPDRMQ
jgi:hypothetical protein